MLRIALLFTITCPRMTEAEIINGVHPRKQSGKAMICDKHETIG